MLKAYGIKQKSMIIQPEELETELYPEIVGVITRSNPEEVKAHIRAAEDFAKAYLFKYDLIALFGTETEPPTVGDEFLKKAIKIIASYFLVRKANPNVSLELFRQDWELIIGNEHIPGWLTNIKNGTINPDWPLKPDDPNTPDDESLMHQDVFWKSTEKRTQRF